MGWQQLHKFGARRHKLQRQRRPGMLAAGSWECLLPSCGQPPTDTSESKEVREQILSGSFSLVLAASFWEAGCRGSSRTYFLERKRPQCWALLGKGALIGLFRCTGGDLKG